MTESAAPAPSTEDPAAHPLTGEVLRWVAEVREAAAEDGETAALGALDAAEARLRRGAAGVVVVGEKKRGKSSLINALVAHPGLVPVDADVATCVHLVVSHGPVLRARAVDDAGEHEIAVSAVAEYAALPPAPDEPPAGRLGTVLVEPSRREPRHPGVEQVLVELPDPLLAHGLELVDTPGVGGLVSGHAALTLAALERADALLFVLDGQSEITASELAFLERATERISTVLFALTKTDLFPAWGSILARNHELIAEHAPRYADAPWFPVDSQARGNAQRALAKGKPELAERRLAASGLVALEESLSRLGETTGGLRLADLAQQATALAKRLAALQVRHAQSLTLAPEFEQRIVEEKAKLTALQSQNATWRITLSERCARAEQTARTELARRLEDLRKDVGDTISTGGTKVFDDVVADLPLRARAIWVEMDTFLRRELGETIETLLADLSEVEIDLSGVVPDLPPERLANLPEPVRGRAATSLAEHGIMAMSLGVVVGTMITSTTGLAPVGIAAGAAVVGLFSGRRHQKEKAALRREDARRHLGEVAARLNTEIVPVISQAVAGTRELLSSHVVSALAAEKERLTASVAEHQKNRASEESALKRRRIEVDAKLRARSGMQQSGQDLVARLRHDGEQAHRTQQGGES